MNDGKSLIAMGTSGNASVYNFVTNKITENFSGVTPSYFLPNFLSVYKDFAIFLNSAGSAISEVSIGGGITNITLPSSYNATGLVEIGNTGNFIISGDNTDNNLLFNASTLTVSTTPYNISHNVLAATYNPMSGTLYVSSFENSLYGNMNLTVINVATGKVLTKLAIPGISTSLVFDPANQQLYASGYTSASLYVYNTTHYYKVTFGQNGLPTGQSWYVNITGQKSSGPISGSTFSIYLPGGDYTYTVQTPVVCCIIPLYNEIQGNDLLL